jgi:hypothetical protein
VAEQGRYCVTYQQRIIGDRYIPRQWCEDSSESPLIGNGILVTASGPGSAEPWATNWDVGSRRFLGVLSRIQGAHSFPRWINETRRTAVVSMYVPRSNVRVYRLVNPDNGNYYVLVSIQDWLDRNVGPLVKPIAQAIMVIAGTVVVRGIIGIIGKALPAVGAGGALPNVPGLPGGGSSPPPASVPSSGQLPDWALPVGAAVLLVLLLK